MVLADAKREIFCQEISMGASKAEAATKAGFSPNGASVTGNRLLNEVPVQDRIAEILKARQHRHEITVDRILKELSVLAFSRFDTFGQIKEGTRQLPNFLKDSDNQEDIDLDDDFSVGETETYKYVDFELTKDIDPELIPAIAFIKQGRNGIELKLHDKTGPIQLAMRYLGLLKDNLKLEGGLNITDQPVTFE